MARLDQRDAPSRPGGVVPLRVGLDLDGSLEPLGNSMNELADAMTADGACSLVRFRTRTRHEPGEAPIRGHRLWAPLWERGRGPAITSFLPDVDVVHVAGACVPPVRGVPLLISVDDLRPLRGESRQRGRADALRRCVEHGATLVASSRAARHELTSVLGLERPDVVVVPPAVPTVHPTHDGENLVVNATGATQRLIALAPVLSRVAQRHGVRVTVLASAALANALARQGLSLDVVPRNRARAALGGARVVFHLADGARFPSLAVAALAAGVPTVAVASDMSREILRGAAALVSDEDDLEGILDDVWMSEARRAVMVAAGRARAGDFAAATVARRYVNLYQSVAQRRVAA